MNQKIFINIIIAVVIILAGAGVYFVLNQRSRLTQFPAQTSDPGLITTTDENIQLDAGTIQPKDSDKLGLAPYPDEPIATALPVPMSIKYLVEHRSGLNNKTIVLKGIVIADSRDETKCPSNAELLCPQPVIFLADTASEDRNPHYDIFVRLSDDDHNYNIGQIVEIHGTVYGYNTVVQLTKNYQ